MTLADAETKLSEATSVFVAADQAYLAASRERTAAINALNDAQGVFDKAVADTRKAAPRDSTWSCSMRVRTVVE